MKKTKIGIGIGIGITVIMISGGLFWGMRKTESSSPFYKMGQEAEKYAAQKDNQIVAKGKDVEVSLKELRMRVNVQEIDKHSADREKILNDLITEKVLYQKAVEESLVFSEVEAEEQVRQLKEMVDTAENKEQVEDVIKGFGGEDAYWKYVKERIIIKGSVNNYKAALEKAAKKERSKDGVSKNASESEIDQLIQEQDVQIDEDVLKELDD